jgi:hypothetical protein
VIEFLNAERRRQRLTQREGRDENQICGSMQRFRPHLGLRRRSVREVTQCHRPPIKVSFLQFYLGGEGAFARRWIACSPAACMRLIRGGEGRESDLRVNATISASPSAQVLKCRAMTQRASHHESVGLKSQHRMTVRHGIGIETDEPMTALA